MYVFAESAIQYIVEYIEHVHLCFARMLAAFSENAFDAIWKSIVSLIQPKMHFKHIHICLHTRHLHRPRKKAIATVVS